MRSKPLSLTNGATYGTGPDGQRFCTGSQMGRRSFIPADYAGTKLRLTRLPVVDGAYDRWGAYWGAPANVWCAWGDTDSEGLTCFVRGNTRDDAKAAVNHIWPNGLPLPSYYR